MTEAALLQQVVAEPEAREPREALALLVGGERERFIRGQLAISDRWRAGRSAPGSYDVDRLVLGNERAWGGPIVERLAARFLRGFVEHVTLDAARFVRDWQELVALAPLRHLDVANVGPVAHDFFQCPGLAKIVALNFDQCGTPRYAPTGDGVVAAVLASPYLQRLRYLDLQRNDLTDSGRSALARAPNLPALECLRIDLPEEVVADYDGTITDIRPGEALYDFEQERGACAWLHWQELHWRELLREAF